MENEYPATTQIIQIVFPQNKHKFIYVTFTKRLNHYFTSKRNNMDWTMRLRACIAVKIFHVKYKKRYFFSTVPTLNSWA